MQYNTQCLWKLVDLLVKQCLVLCSLGGVKRKRKAKNVCLNKQYSIMYEMVVRLIFC